MNAEPIPYPNGRFLLGGMFGAAAFLENNPAVFDAIKVAAPAEVLVRGRWGSGGIGPEDSDEITTALLHLITDLEGPQTVKLELRFSFERGAAVLPLEELKLARELDLRVVHNSDEPGEEETQFELPLPPDPNQHIDRVIDWLTRHP